MATDTARHRAELVLLAITAGWALTFVIIKDALTDADPFPFVATRFGLAFLAGAALARRRLWDSPTFMDALRLAPFMFAGYALQTMSLVHTTPARSAFLTGLAVLFVPLFAFVRTRRIPGWPVLAGVGLATAGLWMLARPDDTPSADTTLGDLLSLGCALAYAGHIALTEGAARRRAALPLVTWQFAIVAVLAASVAPFHGLRFDPSWRLGGALLFCSLLASLAFVGLQTWAQRYTSATRAAIVFTVEPAVAAAFSVVMGREPLTLALVMGGGLLAAAVLVAQLGGEAWTRWFGAEEGAGHARPSTRTGGGERL